VSLLSSQQLAARIFAVRDALVRTNPATRITGVCVSINQYAVLLEEISRSPFQKQHCDGCRCRKDFKVVGVPVIEGHVAESGLSFYTEEE